MIRPTHFQFEGQRNTSGTTCSDTRKLRLAVFLSIAVVMLQGVAAQGDITSWIGFDSTYSYYDYSDSDGYDTISYSGSFSSTAGGVTTTSTFDKDADGSYAPVISGANPLSATLTDIGDGLGLTANVAGEGDTEFLVGIDFAVEISGTSTATFEFLFTNTVDADGDNAYVDSEFTLFEDPDGVGIGDTGPEIFFTDLISDTLYGDELNGGSTGTSGDLLTDSGLFSHTVTLLPGETKWLVGSLTMEGGDFVTGGESYMGAFTGELRLVPVPGAALLGALGLGYAGYFLRRHKGLR